MEGKKKYKLKKKVIFYALEIIFISLIIFSGIKIFIWWNNAKKSEKIMENVREAIQINEDISDSRPNEKYKIDFEKLKSQNSDTIAWLKVNGTKIEYPVVKTDNNNYYLTHSFDKSSNIFGWVFANNTNKFDGTDKNITIFAHGMINGSMFGTLKETFNDSWRKQNYKIILATEKEISVYEVYSTYKIEDEYYFFKSSFSDNEFNEFIKTTGDRSNYNYDIEVNENDQILTLATCDINDKYRLVLHAKKIKIEQQNETNN